MKATLLDANRLLLEGSVALSQVESNGIRIDEGRLDRTIAKVDGRIRKLTDRLRADDAYRVWRREFGDKTNLGSRPQLGKILFGVMGLPCTVWTDKSYDHEGNLKPEDERRPSTTEEALEGVSLPFVRRLLKVEKWKHLRGTFLMGLKRQVVKGKYHPDFNQHTAKSYRSSSGGEKERTTRSSGFNFQNLPVRDDELAPMIRMNFVPRKGCRLVENDFSAHEFRLAAIRWGDPNMMAYASDPDKDVHRDLAAKIYRVAKSLVDKSSRYCGKNGFVFPRLYGSNYIRIARNMWLMIESKKLSVDGVPMMDHLRSKGILELGECDRDQEARPGTFELHVKGVERWFDDLFPVFRDRREKEWQEYRERGWFEMLTGFRVEGLYTKNAFLNYGVQGPAYHCLLWTIIEVQKELNRRQMRAKIVGQIHDCVISDVPDRELQDYLNLVHETVTVKLPKAWRWITVPLGVEAEVTGVEESWYGKKQWVERDGMWVPKE